ncbi:MAG: hypothetical protein K8T91_18715 [Planctomycetes bacterium]|nr:hypothetical protein [Planctomycetota bacterium]
MSKHTPRCAISSVPTMTPATCRASWIGTLRLGSLLVPVKAYPTISTPDSRLHQMHTQCGQRIEYRRCCPKHGEVRAEGIAKAYAYAVDHLVELTPDELARVSPIDEKAIILERFFDQDHLDLTLLAGRSLYLAPENPAGVPVFASLLAALLHARKWALGRVVFSGRRQLVVIHPGDDTLILHTLHDPVQRRAPVLVPKSAHSPAKGEVHAIERLIQQTSGPISWTEYHDDADERLARLVADKVQASQTPLAAGLRLAKPDSRNSKPRRKAKAA